MVNVTNVHHLALFICHLFIDGHFRTAHFLYKPNTFNFDLLLQIDTVCSEPITFYLTDINLPLEWPWNDKDSPDNVLQLCFFDQRKLTEDISQLKPKSTALHWIFGFHSNDTANMGKQTTTFDILRQLPDSKILVVGYNSKNVTIFVDNGLNKKLNRQPIFVVNNKTNFNDINLFDRTFGEYERKQSISIEQMEYKDIWPGIDTTAFFVQKLWMNYYHLQLNNSLLHMIDMDTLNEQYCTLQSSNYYKELSTEYKCNANGYL